MHDETYRHLSTLLSGIALAEPRKEAVVAIRDYINSITEENKRLRAFRDTCAAEAKRHTFRMAYLDEKECDCAMCVALAELDREASLE